MGASNYDLCLAQVLKYEGGYTNHPSDPGGATNWGITIHDARRYWKSDATAEDVRKMPLSVAKQIYRARYWNVVDGDNLHDGVDLAVFDYGVNSGPGRALPDFKPYRSLPPVEAIKALCARRLRFLKALRTWPVFGGGWGSRVASVEAIGVKMALKVINAVAPTATPQQKADAQIVVKKELEKHAEDAAGSVKKNTQAGAAAGGAAGGGVATDPTIVTQFDWVSFSVIALMVGVALFIGYRIFINLQRKKAYLDAAATA